MSAPSAERMRPDEIRAGVSLAAIFALRMLGLFLILPVFSIYARGIPGGDSLTLVGIALGAYGLTQAMFQLPFGMASDRYGRKPAIVSGLLIFAAGSFLAGAAQDIYVTIAGRSLQGAGAISAAVTALAADLTREEHRTKVMAMIGSSIGVVFAASLILAPALYAWIGMNGIFHLTGVLAVGAIAVVAWVVPPAPQPEAAPQAGVHFTRVLFDPQLARLNFGIFALHAMQMGLFVVVPAALVAQGALPVAQHWKIYLPVVFASFVLMLPAILYAEKRARLKPVFIGAIALLLACDLGFLALSASFYGLLGLLLAFFVAFNILEASLPSLVSRIAPARAKGTALGIYNTMQSLGLFAGGGIGGLLAKYFGMPGVFSFAALLAAAWLLLAGSMRAPPVIAKREFALAPGVDVEAVRAELAGVSGVREALLVPEKGMAYLKVNLERWDEARVRQLLGAPGRS
ncbi:MAG: MFS transporter [Rhodocyclaceae bacterium]